IDASIAGSIATTAGLAFLGSLLFAPDRGVIAGVRRRARQRLEFSGLMLAIHLLHHEKGPRATEENRMSHLQEHLGWTADFARRVARRAEREGWIARRPGGALELTPLGREVARHRMVQ
ncbi:MAG: metal ABC transporter permease, partial [Gemmatimonadota bacterium]